MDDVRARDEPGQPPKVDQVARGRLLAGGERMQGHALAPAQLEPGVDPGGQASSTVHAAGPRPETRSITWRVTPSGGYAVKRRRRRADVVKDELSFLGSRASEHTVVASRKP